jgi:hypothetical protein
MIATFEHNAEVSREDVFKMLKKSHLDAANAFNNLVTFRGMRQYNDARGMCDALGLEMHMVGTYGQRHG